MDTVFIFILYILTLVLLSALFPALLVHTTHLFEPAMVVLKRNLIVAVLVSWLSLFYSWRGSEAAAAAWSVSSSTTTYSNRRTAPRPRPIPPFHHQRASSRTTARRRQSSTTGLFMVESLNLRGTDLDDDHEQVGQELADSVQRMLDAEWMPQKVHERMANDVQQTYVACRKAGQDDVATILMQVADDLTANWDGYHDDSFVGPYDVANYCSDWLVTKSGQQEGCACTHKIY